MTWTNADDVIAAWIGPDAPTNLTLVGVWVEKAERLLRSKLPDLQARMDAGSSVEPDLAGNVQDVVTEMVQEVFRNPERVRQRQEGTGPFTGSVTFGGDKPGALTVTADQLATLVAPGASEGAFTIDMIPSSSPFSDNYVAPLNSWEIA